ncbi:MAG: hypothetical protein ACRDT4_08125 [Micromonosporaceae bacterium]
MAYDFASWFDRTRRVLVRSWKGILQLILLGYVVPVVLLAVLTTAIGFGSVVGYATIYNLRYDHHDPGAPSGGLPIVLALVALVFVAVIGVLYLNAVTSLAIVKVATNDAAGTPLRPYDAFRSSLRLGWPTLGWMLVAGLIIGIGFVACILPGIYLLAVTSLIVPIMAYERQGGFVGSFRLVHTNFWPAVGQLLLLYAAALVVSWLANILLSVASLPVSTARYGMNDLNGSVEVLSLLVSFGSAVVLQLIEAVSQLVLVTGFMVTYAQLRGRLQPDLSTAQLAAEVNA